ncbi:MAG: S46 family peptidase [Actinomycetota bacterium]
MMKLKKYRFFAVMILTAGFISSLPFYFVRADEGMFMMDKLASLPLAEKGLKIRSDEIYNSSGTGLSIAVPRLSIGCSSEFVSPDGLILTNHHCGFDALVAASTTEKNYGETGYRAASRSEELPAKGYSIDITLKEEDVTARVLEGINPEDADAVGKRINDLQKQEQAKMSEGGRVQIQPLNGGMYYYLFAYQTIRDIRIVYAPPKSIGFYGGDPDNFEWTRHCGDFTFMRAYVAPDGKSADYSANNVPFKPKKYLTISADGVKENDFTMIIGYPGGTTRYRESYSIAFNQDVNLPFTVEVLNANIEALQLIARSNPEKAVELQSEIFSLNNSLKAEEGGVVAMRRAGLVKQRQTAEAKLTEWINQNAERKAKYGEALPNLKAAYGEYSKTARKDLVLRNMLEIAPIQLIIAAQNGFPKERLKAAVPEIAATQPVVNRELAKFLLRKAADLPAEQRIAAIEKRFGGLNGEARLRAEDEFARQSFESETITTEKGLNSLIEMTSAQMKTSSNPLVAFINEIASETALVDVHQQTLNAVLAKNRLPFMRAMAEMGNLTRYPDANFTQRLTFGAVKGYKPKESVTFEPFTTLDGVFEKDTGHEPFNAPAKLRELWEKKDYGNHAVNGTIPVDFLTTNDIIGGNSGSPVLNGSGEQVGIAFDGNYEGLGDDFFFNPELGRTIVVDIRYVLFLTDKFGDAGWILKEMNIKGGNRKAMTMGN